MIVELLSSIVLATNVSGCVVPTVSYLQEFSFVTIEKSAYLCYTVSVSLNSQA